MGLGSTLVRGVVGPLFVGHGTQKLFGWFGGHGLEGTGGYFETLGLKPGRRHATAAGVVETAGGALLTLGAITPLAASMIAGTMVTAIRKAHADNGPWITNGGYEYNLVVIAAMAAVADAGPGSPSFDEQVLPRLHGPLWALMAVGGAVAGSYLATSDLVSETEETPREGHGVPGDPAANPEAAGAST